MSNIDWTSQTAFRSGIITTASDILPNANLNRRTILLQNLGTNPLYVKFGTGATTSDFDFILKGGLANDDGNGGIFSEDVLSYQGILSIAGTSVRAIATSF